MPVFVDNKYGHMVDIDWNHTEFEGHKQLDVHAAVDIVCYTKWLLDQPEEKRLAVAKAVDILLELRGWFFESYMQNSKNFPDVQQGEYRNIYMARMASLTTDKLREAVVSYVKPIATMLDLGVSED